MAARKKHRVTSNSHHHKTSNERRKIVFFVSFILIGLMLWQVLVAVTESSAAGGRNGKVCKPGAKSSWFSFCQVGATSNSCGSGCTCAPFSKRMRWGVCRTGSAAVIAPVDTQATKKGCGVTCTLDTDCATGYCHPGGFDICPTSVPGQPIEQCQFIPPDPTQPNVCMPIQCKTGTNCSCPTGQNPPGSGGGGTSPGNNGKDDDKDGETDEQDEKPGSNGKDDDKDGQTDEPDEKIGNNKKDDDSDGIADEADEKDDDKVSTGSAETDVNIRYIFK